MNTWCAGQVLCTDLFWYTISTFGFRVYQCLRDVHFYVQRMGGNFAGISRTHCSTDLIFCLIGVYCVVDTFSPAPETVHQALEEQPYSWEECCDNDYGRLEKALALPSMLSWDASERAKEQIKAFEGYKRSMLTEALININGDPFSFKNREYLKPIYDADYPFILLRTGRQVEKSSTLGTRILTEMFAQPYTKCLYVSPSHDQTRQFSNEKLKQFMDASELIQKYMLDSNCSHQVFEKSMLNGSMIFLRSCFLTPDRARGISCSTLCIDEIQDVISSNIPVIAEALSHADNPRRIYSGTPKSLDNVIEDYWNMGSQCEWLVPCDHHTPRYWVMMDERAIGLEGPICPKCGKRVDPRTGQWVSFNSSSTLPMGFHISQVMVHWIYSNPEKWQELLWKREHYPRAQFFNECLGIGYDSAFKPISQKELIEACHPERRMIRHPKDSRLNYPLTFAGIDWGEGADGSDKGPTGKIRSASYTVLTIGVPLTPVDFHIFFAKKYTGHETDPNFFIPDIIKYLRLFKVTMVGADWGFGAGFNKDIRNGIGLEKLIPFFYTGFLKERRKWDPIGSKYILNRNEVMTNYFVDLKRKHITYPRWADIEPYAKDILNIYKESNEFRRTFRYDHRPSNPDDFAHSSIFCREAYYVYLYKGVTEYSA